MGIVIIRHMCSEFVMGLLTFTNIWFFKCSMVIPPRKMTKAQWDHARRNGCCIEIRVSKGVR